MIVCSPPGADGEPSPVVLAAAALAEVDHVFSLGGAGAVAAMALGTATVPVVQRHMAHGAEPARYTYMGEVFRRQEHLGGRAREYLQVGYEVFARDDPEDHRARAVKAVDPGVVLARRDVEPQFVAQEVCVERLLKQTRRDLGVAIAVGEARAYRVGGVEHLVGHIGVRVLAVKPGVHLAFLC